jgi:hypothetical protein
MTRTKYVAFGLLLSCAVTATLRVSSAESGTSCQDLIEGCFAAANDDRGACFETASKNTLCQHSELGALAAKRAQFSSTTPSDNDDGPAFLGPQIINTRCVTNFDHAWSASLISGTPSKEVLSTLATTLQTCAQGNNPELTRP